MAIFNICQISEIHGIKGFNYIRIGLATYVEFILGKWFIAGEKIIENHTQETPNHASFRMHDQNNYHRISN